MRLGADFVAAIEEAIDHSDALVAVIGRDWVRSDPPRPDDSKQDWVLHEIAYALRAEIPVFPVVVGGATMPTERQLPQEVRAFARRHATQFSEATWHDQLKLLVAELEQLPARQRGDVGAPAPRRRDAFLDGWEAMRAGQSYQERGYPRFAGEEYKRALDSDERVAPHAAEALGDLCVQQGAVPVARMWYERAIDSGDSEVAPRAAISLGAALARRDFWQDARVAYERAIRLGGNNAPVAMVLLGQLLEEHGDPTGALAAFQRAQASPRADVAATAALKAGALLLRTGELAKARAAFRIASTATDPAVAQAAQTALDDL